MFLACLPMIISATASKSDASCYLHFPGQFMKEVSFNILFINIGLISLFFLVIQEQQNWDIVPSEWRDITGNGTFSFGAGSKMWNSECVPQEPAHLNQMFLARC